MVSCTMYVVSKPVQFVSAPNSYQTVYFALCRFAAASKTF